MLASFAVFTRGRLPCLRRGGEGENKESGREGENAGEDGDQRERSRVDRLGVRDADYTATWVSVSGVSQDESAQDRHSSHMRTSGASGGANGISRQQSNNSCGGELLVNCPFGLIFDVPVSLFEAIIHGILYGDSQPFRFRS